MVYTKTLVSFRRRLIIKRVVAQFKFFLKYFEI